MIPDPSRPAFAADDRYVAEYLDQSAAAMAAFAADPATRPRLHAIGRRITDALAEGGKLMVAGNGGSAADAQHIAGEFVARLMYDRRPLAALALTTDSSAMTATGNDYGFDHLFSRQIEALGRPGDVFLAISTSGRSPNVLRALASARRLGLVTVGFTGLAPGAMTECDELLAVPSAFTPVIQQLHITAAHVVCALVERALCPPPPT